MSADRSRYREYTSNYYNYHRNSLVASTLLLLNALGLHISLSALADKLVDDQNAGNALYVTFLPWFVLIAASYCFFIFWNEWRIQALADYSELKPIIDEIRNSLPKPVDTINTALLPRSKSSVESIYLSRGRVYLAARRDLETKIEESFSELNKTLSYELGNVGHPDPRDIRERTYTALSSAKASLESAIFKDSGHDVQAIRQAVDAGKVNISALREIKSDLKGPLLEMRELSDRIDAKVVSASKPIKYRVYVFGIMPPATLYVISTVAYFFQILDRYI